MYIAIAIAAALFAADRVLNALIYRAAGTVEYAARRFEASIPPLRSA